jgi:hypothetical protein
VGHCGEKFLSSGASANGAELDETSEDAVLAGRAARRCPTGSADQRRRWPGNLGDMPSRLPLELAPVLSEQARLAVGTTSGGNRRPAQRDEQRDAGDDQRGTRCPQPSLGAVSRDRRKSVRLQDPTTRHRGSSGLPALRRGHRPRLPRREGGLGAVVRPAGEGRARAPGGHRPAPAHPQDVVALARDRPLRQEASGAPEGALTGGAACSSDQSPSKSTKPCASP